MESWHSVMERVVRDRRRALVGYAYLLTGSMADAEEVAQEAIVKAFVRGRSKTTVDSAESYVKRAIANEVISRARRANVANAKKATIALPEASESHDGWVGAHADLHSALAGLSPQERACIVLKYFEDMTTPQISVALKLAEGTVKRYVFNASGKLRVRLGSDAVDAAPRETARVALGNGGK